MSDDLHDGAIRLEDFDLRSPDILDDPDTRPALPLAAETLDDHTRRNLRKEELAIARPFHGGGQWPYVTLAIVCFGIWLSFFPLAYYHRLNLPFAFLFSWLCASGGYLTGHEAMHSNLWRRGEKYRWLNELVGWISTVPIATPYTMVRITHLEHHQNTNHPERDPDYTDDAPNALMAWYITWYNRQPGVDGSVHHYKRVCMELGTPEAKRALRDTAIMQIVYYALLFAMAWGGYGIEAAAIWWLPRHVGLSYTRFWLSWAPHTPRHKLYGRYRDTLVFKSRVGHLLSMGMQYHVVHHLYPNIPIHRTKACYYALRHILVARGVDCSAQPARN